MDVSHIEHIGIAVKNLDESIEKYEKLFNIKCYAIEEVKDQKVKTAFFQNRTNQNRTIRGYRSRECNIKVYRKTW